MLRVISLQNCYTKRQAFAIALSRSFSPSIVRLDEESAAAALAKEAAAEYSNKRVTYKRQVSALRKQYASEVALQRAADQAEQAAREKKEARKKLERQRLKNIMAAQSSVREMEKRKQRELEFQEELRIAQINRDARNERFRKARQLLIDELEEEAPFWLTTNEEVEAAFTKASEQELWAFPNSVVGAPAPTDDAQFWNYESHTWHLEKTYRTQEEALFEEFTEQAYHDANVDKAYWTEDRLEERKALEEKAKLRAMVRDAGRRALLLKQKELLQDNIPSSESKRSKIPRPMPVPNLSFLINDEAVENEGAQVLMKDPTQFFEFDDQHTNESDGVGEYEGPSLGIPVGLKDNVRVEKTLNKAYPDVLGKMPKPDMRTAKEKKREERERAMLAAARAKDDDSQDIHTDDLDDIDAEKIDLDGLVFEGDEEWAEGLDPDADKHLLNTPRRERYSEEDIDLVIERLEKKIRHLEGELDYELNLVRQQIESRADQEEQPREFQPGNEVKTTYSIVADDQVFDVSSLGVNTAELDALYQSLTDEQMIALHAIDRETDGLFSLEELRGRLSNEVPGLTSEQVEAIIRVEETLSSHDSLATKSEEVMLGVDVTNTSNENVDDEKSDVADGIIGNRMDVDVAPENIDEGQNETDPKQKD
jgi:hypothetical protein